MLLLYVGIGDEGNNILAARAIRNMAPTMGYGDMNPKI